MGFKLISWNVHGLPWPITQNLTLRMQAIAERIEAEEPDVVAFQEAWPGSLGSLEAGLPSYTLHYSPTTFGNASGGLVILLRNGGALRADATSLQFRSFSRYGALHRFWEADGLAGKGALFLPLEAGDGTRIWIVNTHLQARYGSRDYRVVRRAQLRELAAWLDSLGSEDPVVIAGDFNTPARIDPAYAELAAIGVDHAWLLHESGTKTTNYPIHSTAGWIDYVLMRSGRFESCGDVRLIENERADVPYSDHSGLVADIVLGPRDLESTEASQEQ